MPTSRTKTNHEDRWSSIAAASVDIPPKNVVTHHARRLRRLAHANRYGSGGGGGGFADTRYRFSVTPGR
jgi:hypothetical protein